LDIFNSIGKFLSQTLKWALGFLPDSPFKLLSNSPIQSLLPYINWFIPFDFMVSTLEAWLIAIAVYYIYSVILRWAKAIN